MTTRDTNGWVANSQTLKPTNGLVSLSTTNENVLGAIYNNMGIGTKDTTGSGTTNLTAIPDSKFQALLIPGDPNVKALVHSICFVSPNRPYWAFQSLFNPNAPYAPTGADDPIAGLMLAIGQENAPNNGFANEIARQDPIRKIVDLISFRQNIFIVVALEQQLESDGATIASEEREMATVFRDAYTGQSFILTTNYYQGYTTNLTDAITITSYTGQAERCQSRTQSMV